MPRYLCLDIDETLIASIAKLMQAYPMLTRGSNTPDCLLANMQHMPVNQSSEEMHYVEYLAINPRATAQLLLKSRAAGIGFIFITSGTHQRNILLPLLEKTYGFALGFFADSIFINREFHPAIVSDKGVVLQSLRRNGLIAANAHLLLLDDALAHQASCTLNSIDFVQARGADLSLAPVGRRQYLAAVSARLGLQHMTHSAHDDPAVDLMPLFRSTERTKLVVKQMLTDTNSACTSKLNIFIHPKDLQTLESGLNLLFAMFREKFYVPDIAQEFINQLRMVIVDNINHKTTTFKSDKPVVAGIINMRDCLQQLSTIFARHMPPNQGRSYAKYRAAPG